MQQAQYVPPPSYSQYPSAPEYPTQSGSSGGYPSVNNAIAYPSLSDYMGLSLQTFAAPSSQSGAVVHVSAQSQRQVVKAPVTSASLSSIKRAAIKPGVTEVVLCKDEDGLVGLKVREISKGVFVQFVAEDSPAAIGGMKFGDQILSINDELIAGYSADKVHKLLKKSEPNNIRLAVRDRPFERIITVTKDSSGVTGFGFQEGKVVSIVKDSSAARNGMVTDHQVVEINGRNVIGLKDKQLCKLMEEGGDVITVTLMPSPIYEHMIKKIGNLIKSMDHSKPDC